MSTPKDPYAAASPLDIIRDYAGIRQLLCAIA
jgi:hypothetical protein